MINVRRTTMADVGSCDACNDNDSDQIFVVTIELGNGSNTVKLCRVCAKVLLICLHSAGAGRGWEEEVGGK